jgi:hypothetical protein
VFFGNGRKGKKKNKITTWSNKMNAYYSNVSDKKLSADLKSAGFKLRNKPQSK